MDRWMNGVVGCYYVTELGVLVINKYKSMYELHYRLAILWSVRLTNLHVWTMIY